MLSRYHSRTCRHILVFSAFLLVIILICVQISENKFEFFDQSQQQSPCSQSQNGQKSVLSEETQSQTQFKNHPISQSLIYKTLESQTTKKYEKYNMQQDSPFTNINHHLHQNKLNNNSSNVTVFVITPTFLRPEQKPELTRVAQSLLPVLNFIHWIIVDDISKSSETTHNDLKKFIFSRFPSITITILKSLSPPKNTKVIGKPRGVGGRRAAIKWLRENAKSGVVYFADDDNTYDSEIFIQMQRTKKVSMWPVGLVTELGVSSPIVKDGKVIGFYDGWNGKRKFPVDMASFAINLELFLKNPSANMPWIVGYEEDELLKSLEIKISDIEPLANNCTEIYVWHTKSIKNTWPKKAKRIKPSTIKNSNIVTLLQNLPEKQAYGSGNGIIEYQSAEGFSLFQFLFGNLS